MMWEKINKFLVWAGFAPDYEEKERDMILVEKLELAQEEDKIRQEEIKKETIRQSFRDNLSRAEKHREKVKLMKKHGVGDIRIAEKIEQCSLKTKYKNF